MAALIAALVASIVVFAIKLRPNLHEQRLSCETLLTEADMQAEYGGKNEALLLSKRAFSVPIPACDFVYSVRISGSEGAEVHFNTFLATDVDQALWHIGAQSHKLVSTRKLPTLGRDGIVGQIAEGPTQCVWLARQGRVVLGIDGACSESAHLVALTSLMMSRVE